MTEQEAINRLTNILQGENDCIREVRTEKGWKVILTIHEETVDSLKMAIEAIKKQIPQRTVESDEYEYDEVCPKCGHKPFTDDNYCANCGQALKIWEDEE